MQTEAELHVVHPVMRLGHVPQTDPLRMYPELQVVHTEVLEQVWQLLKVVLHN